MLPHFLGLEPAGLLLEAVSFEAPFPGTGLELASPAGQFLEAL